MERKWQMRRLGAGAWLLLSNDGVTWWRLQKVEERDGSLSRGDGTVICGDFWSALRWIGTLEELRENLADGFPDRWREEAQMMKTRQEAIDYALSREQVSR